GINARGQTLILGIHARYNSNTGSTRAYNGHLCQQSSSCSLSISASNSSTATSSIGISPVVARGISELVKAS
ncbi:hypothetical protein H5410_052242, partial [Solanum commersonii]